MIETSAASARRSVLLQHLHWIVTAAFIIPLVYVLVAKAGNITINPNSLYYSEFSNIFNSSLFWSRSIYGESLPLPLLDPARMFLDGLIFALPVRSLVLYRAWTTLLSVIIPLATAYALARRLTGSRSRWLTPVTLGSFLFFQQGPIYPHVLIAPLVVLLFYNQDRMWKRLLVVVLASIWTGLCRINWIPFPGVLMAVLYLLDTPINSKKVIPYLVTPALIALVGLLAGVASYLAYSFLTGNPLIHIDPSYNYPFFWRRWFPNSVYVLGVLPGILLVSVPLLLAIFTWYWHNRGNIHIMRVLPVAAAFFVFGLGGLVVSIRMGGTFNLHNMDGFLILLAVVGGSILFNRPQGEADTVSLERAIPRLYPALLLLILLVPLAYNLYFTRVRFRPNVDTLDYAAIQTIIDERKDERPVLFMDFRHLITFKKLQVDLYLPYEKVFVMENVMGNNQAFLEEFTNRVENQEFSMIFSHGESYPRPFTQLDYILAPEENGWAEKISIPIIENHNVVFRDIVVIYTPKGK